MARLRMMRAPQKYVQGKDSLFKFHEEMKDLETNSCLSVQEVDTKCAMIRLRRVLKEQKISASMRFLVVYPVLVRLNG